MADEKAFHEGEEKQNASEIDFGQSLFPTKTAGSGRIRPNSARTGKGQGRASTRRMYHCKQCGFIFDSAHVSTDTGTYEGNGAAGGIAVQTVQGSTLSGSDKIVDTFGSVAYNKNAGCPFCLSKNIRSMSSRGR